MARACRILLLLALGGCGSPASSGKDMTVDMAMSMDMTGSAPCNADAGGPTHQTTCGPMTCPAGMICLVFYPGVPPLDGGLNPTYSCEVMPPACGCASGCGMTTGAPGCFSSLCYSGEQCRFDGATLQCFGV